MAMHTQSEPAEGHINMQSRGVNCTNQLIRCSGPNVRLMVRGRLDWSGIELTHKSCVNEECQTGASAGMCSPNEPVKSSVESADGFRACSNREDAGRGRSIESGVVSLEVRSEVGTGVTGPKCKSLTHSISNAGHVARW